MNDGSTPDLVGAPSTDAVGPPAPRPCNSCPYRRDVPSGVWHADEYDKLREYDKEMPEQSLALFHCHQNDADSDLRRLCAGWAGCHGDNLLALRLALVQNRISPAVFEATIGYRSPTTLFGSGTEAADHGQREIDNPSPAAVHTIAKISRRRSDLL
ncbi:hypothetical protein B7C42_07619 [Nocardia cerradoensis]|uniref:Uncharacterized protein n=1 Tax=Nocardia cerradoensis TaxID=85688 RepID=A0A231GUX2_9NOCA|nr:DUF6283 family protein [Nocardia cerradoensis]OXR40281.1 hypothetical protein B7C42_07619 [Nocardia cerradoensis]